MRRSIQRITAPARARQLRLAAAAAFGLAVLGGSTLYLLHRTMSVPMQSAPSSVGPAAAGAPIAPATAGVAATSTPGAKPTRVPAESAIGPLPRPEAAPVSLRVPMPSEPSDAPDAAGGGQDRGDARARRAAKREPARSGRTGPTATKTATPRAAEVRAARSLWAGELEATGAGSAGPRGRPAATDDANLTASIQPVVPAAAPGVPQRLEPLKQARCGDSEFLMKLICGERVRLRFCQTRWNAHPDCMVEARALTY